MRPLDIYFMPFANSVRGFRSLQKKWVQNGKVAVLDTPLRSKYLLPTLPPSFLPALQTDRHTNNKQQQVTTSQLPMWCEGGQAHGRLPSGQLS